MPALNLTAANLDGTRKPPVFIDGVVLGAAMTAGLVVYKDGVTLRVATVTSALTAAAIGLYANTAANPDQPSIIWGNGTFVTGFPTMVAGTPYYLGANGTIVPFDDLTTGQYMTMVGYADTTTVFCVHIIPMGRQKA